MRGRESFVREGVSVRYSVWASVRCVCVCGGGVKVRFRVTVTV